MLFQSDYWDQFINMGSNAFSILQLQFVAQHEECEFISPIKGEREKGRERKREGGRDHFFGQRAS